MKCQNIGALKIPSSSVEKTTFKLIPEMSNTAMPVATITLLAMSVMIAYVINKSEQHHSKDEN